MRQKHFCVDCILYKQERGANNEIRTAHNAQSIKSRLELMRINHWRTWGRTLSITYLNNKDSINVELELPRDYLKSIRESTTQYQLSPNNGDIKNINRLYIYEITHESEIITPDIINNLQKPQFPPRKTRRGG